MSRFSFDQALSWAFKAPHARSYFIVYPLVYAVAWGVLLALAGALVYAQWPQFVAGFEALEAASESGTGPGIDTAAIVGLLARATPVALLLMIGGWMLWAMFEAASQRRFVRGEKFSLGFGADEMRMMWVGLLFGLLGLVIFAIPIVLIFAGAMAAIAAETAGLSEDQVVGQMLPLLGGGMLAMFLMFFVYVFFATRLAPCFGLTIKDRKAKFNDAWNVSRGRFWPILGAFVILYIVGSIVLQIFQALFQFALMPALMMMDPSTTGEPNLAVFTSPGFVIPAALAVFVNIAASGLYMHVIAAPAAFAARHDPRGSVEDGQRIEAFS